MRQVYLPYHIIDVMHATLKNHSYYQEKFSKISLSKETIHETEFEECTFHDCSVVDCTFDTCKFINCTFSACLISALIPYDCRFVDVRFTDSNVIGIDWTKTQHVEDLKFTHCQINFSSFRMMELPRLEATGCEAKEVDFTEADIHEGIVTNTDFEGSIFSKTNLTKANFKGAKNYRIDAMHNTITKAIFSYPEALSLLRSFDIVIE